MTAARSPGARIGGAALLALTLGAGPAAADCADQAGPCAVPMGEYHLALPAGDGPHPALVMLHGAGGRGDGMMALVEAAATDRGYAVIGPQGLPRPRGRGGASWSFRPGAPQIRDEAAFLEEVLSHAAEVHGIDRAAVLLGGFSIGGSLATYLACSDPGLARAYAPVGGSFWRPHPAPADCAGPVDLLHTHGWTDGTVPIEGRVLRNGALRQGDVFASLEIWREVNGCRRSAPDAISTEGPFWHRVWSSCAGGSLDFALHPGGHAVPRGWVDLALDWFEAL